MVCSEALRVCIRWSRRTIPLVNPTAETQELLVANSDPRHYRVEMDSGSTVSTHTLTPLCGSYLVSGFAPDIRLIQLCSRPSGELI